MAQTIGPSPIKVTLFYLSFVLLIIAPTIGLLIWGFMGPDPYLFDRQSFKERWVGKKLQYSNYAVDVHRTESAAEARKTAQRLFDATPARSRLKTLAVYRYTRTDSGQAGLLLPLEEYIFRVEAADRKAVDDALARLPYIKENPEINMLYTLFEKHMEGVFAGFAAYVFALLLYLSKGSAAVAQIKPDSLKRPRMTRELKGALLKLSDLDIPFMVSEKSAGELVCEWRVADQKWSGILRDGGLHVNHRITLKFDSDNHIVRAVTTKKMIRREAGILSYLSYFSWARTIDFYSYSGETQYGLDFRSGTWRRVRDYGYQYNVNQIRDPLVRMIIDSGWVYRPVLGFSLLLR